MEMQQKFMCKLGPEFNNKRVQKEITRRKPYMI